MLIRLLLVPLAASWAIVAQINTGTIVGTIVDPQGLVIAGAQAVLTSDATGDARKTVTNDVGAFAFPAVPAGPYTLKNSAC